MSFQITANIKVVFPVTTINEKLTKQEFVIETTERYPQVIKFEILNERIDQMQGFEAGDPVTVHFDIAGREYQKDGATMYFNSLRAWKLDRPGAASSAPPPAKNTQQEAPAPLSADTGNDDLPF